jgi:DtxR family Mn-dependent transcriptional regulator
MTDDDQRRRVTSAMEDYLKAIYLLQQEQRQATNQLLAERLAIKPTSVTGMVKTLSDLHLVVYTPYQGVVLTEAGRKIALEVLRHHRLLELYLVEALGYSWDEVHAEAEALEHVISEKLEAKIAAHLGHPTVDPHGDPIPSLEGEVPEASTTRLADLGIGERGRLTRVLDQHAERLRYLTRLGLVPGALLEVIDSAPFEGPVSVRVGDAVHPLDRRLARMLLVEPLAAT